MDKARVCLAASAFLGAALMPGCASSGGAIGSIDHLGFVTSLIVVYGIGLPVLFGWAVRGVLRARGFSRQARLAEAAYDPHAPLQPGPIILHGTVEHAADAERAVRLEVHQEGSESESSGSWTTSWKETNRRMHVEPFYLRLASGSRIRVEPTEQVYLVDAMDGAIRVDLTRRTRVAELTPGEQVFAHGRLVRDLDPETEGGPYRATREALVLRPPRSGPMLLSTEPLGARFHRRRRWHLGAAIGILIVGVLFQLTLLPYHARVWGGRTVEGTVAGLRHYTTIDDEGDPVHHYQVSADVGDVGQLSDDVPEEVFHRLAKGQQVPWRLVRWWPNASAIGPSPTAHAAALFMLPIVLFVALLVYVIAGAGAGRWYDEARLEEAEGGRLAESLERDRNKGTET